jgi:hypothetical protein
MGAAALWPASEKGAEKSMSPILRQHLAWLALSLGLLTATAAAADLALDQRATAARGTAANQSACKAIRPFYWEIGDARATLVAGSEGNRAPNATTSMEIASASKWLFGAYVVQRSNGRLDEPALAALTMTSGYTSLRYPSCGRRLAQAKQTVSDCFHARNLRGTNDRFDASAVDHFFYNGGHFQKYAAEDLQLGSLDNAALALEMRSQLGSDIAIEYDSPQLAAGVVTTPAIYSLFLKKVLGKQLLIGERLGSHAVCRNPATCSDALSPPVPRTQSWHYSLAHWVEDDPKSGDGAFSSAGAFGFYPWIDASGTFYGVIARESRTRGAYADSVRCGQLIRKAWLSATAQ